MKFLSIPRILGRKLRVVVHDTVHLNPLLQTRFFCIGLAVELGFNSLVGSLRLAK
jgi:hypothetical protein